MHIVSAYWTPRVNMYVIKCKCGNYIEHATNKWHVRCEVCGACDSLSVIRERPLLQEDV